MSLFASSLNFALAESGESMSVAKMFIEASPANKIIICLLVFLLLLQIYTAVERSIMYLQSNAASQMIDEFIRRESQA